MKIKNLKAFTLAEVLMALTVIGIVAAMTIPNLIKNHNEKAWSTAKTVFLEHFEEATKQMNIEGQMQGYKSTGDFLNVLKKYLKINTICDIGKNYKCFADSININDGQNILSYDVNELKSSINFKKNFGTEIRAVALSNGTSMLLTYNPNCEYINPYDNQADTTKCAVLYYDVNGKKSPNTIGKDIFSLNNPELMDSCYKLESGLCVALEDIAPEAVLMSDPNYDNYLSITGVSEPCIGSGQRCGGYDNLLGAALACYNMGMRLPSYDELRLEILPYTYSNNNILNINYCQTGNIENGCGYYSIEKEASSQFYGARVHVNGYLKGFTGGRSSSAPIQTPFSVRCVK